MSTQLIDDKVKFGRALSALSRHTHVLSNGLLPSQSLEERASIAHGIVENRIYRGMVGEAINLLYSGKSQARLLFGADSYPQFKQFITDRLNSGKKVEVDSEALELLKAKGEGELLYHLLLHADFSTDTIWGFISEDTPQDQRSKLLTKIGILEMEDGKFSRAYKNFTEANDNESLRLLYHELGRNPLEHFDLREKVLGAIKIVEGDPIVKKNNLQQCYLEFLEAAKKNPTDVNGLHLFTVFHKAKTLGFRTPTYKKMLDIMASRLSFHELTEKVTIDDRTKLTVSQIDPSFPLRWARHHCSTDPKEAYEIFKEAKYKGKEVTTAVLSGLSLACNDDRSIDHSDVKNNHLLGAYPEASLEVKRKIASTLQDPKKLQALSREYRKRKDFEKSYHLWIEGNGDLNDRTFVDTRRRIIDKEFQGTVPSSYCLDDQDVEGNRIVFHRFMQQESYEPHRAYEIALNLKDADLTQMARVEMVKRNPVRALEIFKEESSIRIKDPVGVDLALTALETRYGVSRTQLNEILALPTK